MGSETEIKPREMNQKEKNLLEWVRRLGFVHENVEISDTVHGRGLVATEDLPADTVIIKVSQFKVVFYLSAFIQGSNRRLIDNR